MKRLIVIALAFTLAACAGSLPSAVNPVSAVGLYQGELAFDATLKTFNELKGLCVARVLPPVCRTYVKKGQTLIVEAYAADKAARAFSTNNPTLDATNVVGAFTGIVADFNATVASLSATKQ